MSPRRLALLAVVALGGVACGERRSPGDCPPESRPAFLLRVRAASGDLPPDTVLEVRHGGGLETLVLGRPSTSRVVFCSTEEEAGALHDLSCELWTAGAVEVRVEADGLPPVERALAAELDECGATRTVSAELVVGDADAG